jgi:hypothetical protein
MAHEPQSFDEFWPYYLSQHRVPATRWLHFAGTTAVVVAAAEAVRRGRPGIIAWLPLLGYGPAWIGHFFVERNKPATFRYPVWSLLADFKMWAGMLAGQRWCGDLEDETRTDT